MRRPVRWVMLAAIAAQGAFAQGVAIYRDEVLTVPRAVVIDGQDSSYFRNVRMSGDGKGNFQVTAAERAALAQVGRVEALLDILDSNRVNVTVSGNKSVPCVDLEEPVVSFKDNVFTIVLAETRLDNNVACIQILDPFEIKFSLDTGDLEPGGYSITVNGVRVEFFLPT